MAARLKEAATKIGSGDPTGRKTALEAVSQLSQDLDKLDQQLGALASPAETLRDRVRQANEEARQWQTQAEDRAKALSEATQRLRMLETERDMANLELDKVRRTQDSTVMVMQSPLFNSESQPMKVAGKTFVGRRVTCIV